MRETSEAEEKVRRLRAKNVFPDREEDRSTFNLDSTNLSRRFQRTKRRGTERARMSATRVGVQRLSASLRIGTKAELQPASKEESPGSEGGGGERVKGGEDTKGRKLGKREGLGSKGDAGGTI